MEKLFIVVRNDLPPGMQMAQVCHAQREFAERFPVLDRVWFDLSNNLVVLQVSDEPELRRLSVAARTEGWSHVCFKEPDLDGQWTAAAFEWKARKLLSSLPLALRSPSVPLSAGLTQNPVCSSSLSTD